jgi:hypothetical protein
MQAKQKLQIPDTKTTTKQLLTYYSITINLAIVTEGPKHDWHYDINRSTAKC